MGNILHISVVLDDIDDAQNENTERSQGDMRLSRDEQLATIRNLNQNAKSDYDRTQLKPIDGTILEEAVLEDLCGEAEIELDQVETGPITGIFRNTQKAELITRLSSNPKTKKYFETSEAFDFYVEEVVCGDAQTNNNLTVEYDRALTGGNSWIQKSENRSERSNMSMSRSKVELPNTRISRKDLSDQLQSYRSNTRTTMMSNRTTTLSHRMSNRMSNRIDSRMSRMTSKSRIHRNTKMQLNGPRSTSPGEPDKTRSILGPEDNRWSKLTSYSLPSDFVNNNYSAMDRVDRRKTSIVCKTNETTLQMATELLQKGKIKPPKEDNSTHKERECLCLVF